VVGGLALSLSLSYASLRDDALHRLRCKWVPEWQRIESPTAACPQHSLYSLSLQISDLRVGGLGGRGRDSDDGFGWLVGLSSYPRCGVAGWLDVIDIPLVCDLHINVSRGSPSSSHN